MLCDRLGSNVAIDVDSCLFLGLRLLELMFVRVMICEPVPCKRDITEALSVDFHFLNAPWKHGRNSGSILPRWRPIVPP